MVGIGAPNELLPKLRVDVSEVKAGESLAEPCAHRYCSPVTRSFRLRIILIMHRAFRLLIVITAVALGVVVPDDAAGDPFPEVGKV